METSFCFSFSYIIGQFKSYYVVWKLFFFISIISFSSSLHRTMQYGNLPLLVFFPAWELFKSYYVVWKPCWVISTFKSYYGLNRTMQYGNGFGLQCIGLLQLMFKSYYVVWKRVEHSCNVLSCIGLNRTMQYGNKENFLGFWTQKQSLNRTMQYGNFLFFLPFQTSISV